ncbi:MAG TPA: RNA polymerase sigma factor, partial [Candidatus Polarisedimenticolaceae bacterium]|nr:RNA polymerase sigma factor [Candidatus Polarisedimenticolaceae bacterium]
MASDPVAVGSPPLLPLAEMPERTISNDGEAAELLAARRGDPHAARAIVARYGDSMIRTAWRVLGTYGARDADDVVQEAFIAALTTTALPRENLGAWLRAIVARKALDELRRKGRRGEQPLDGATTRLAAEDRLGSRVEVLAVRRALARLSPADRALLTLVDLEGWSLAE